MTKEIYSDVSMAFTRNFKTSDLTKNINIDAIRNSIRNILQTKKMERRMMPEFGGNLESLLFEPIDVDTAKRIGSLMSDELTGWEPRIIVENIDVVADEDNMRYDIVLTYSIKSSDISRDVIEFTLSA